MSLFIVHDYLGVKRVK